MRKKSSLNKKEIVLFPGPAQKKGRTAEDLLWQRIKDKQVWGYDFLRQKSCGRYLLDFFCPELSLAVAVDGNCHLNDGYSRDRDRELNKQGVKAITFDDMTIKKNIEGVIVAIEVWIDRKTKGAS